MTAPLPRPWRRREWLAAAMAGAAAQAGAQPGAERQVRLARPHFRIERTGWYPMAVLQAALAASGRGWSAQIADRMTDARALLELSSPDGQIDVVVGMPTAERVQLLRLVPAPLYLGLFGWRVLVVRQGEARRWQGLRRVQDLRALRCLQGQDWPDTDILRANGVPVLTGARVQDLYERLAHGEGDAFPRGITEAWGEVRGLGPGFEIVPQVVLSYRSDLCFFVRRDDTALAEALLQGLQALHRSRQLHRALLQEHGADLRLADLPHRHAIRLDAPGMPAAVRDMPAAWWTPPKV